MTLDLVAWLVLGFLALVALHELTHVLIAACHGHPTVCIAINPVGVAVVFEDAPRVHYWMLQVILPALVSWAVCYAWLYGLFTYPSTYNAGVDIDAIVAQLPWIVTLITVLTSGGDILSGYVDVTNPVHGPDRVHRGFAVLRKTPALVLFTAHGRKHWHATWTSGAAEIAPVSIPARS
jgi:hypothetical protein